jgi:HlyD family secretion protein
VDVREGDRVSAGQVLAALDRTELEARHEQARAQVAAARAVLSEMESGSRSEEIAQARAARDGAGDRLADAERDVERTRRLFEGGAISRELYDKALLARDVASAQYTQAAQQAHLVETGPRKERVEAARAQLAQAQAALAVAAAVLENLTLEAPFDGVVTARHREPGEIVSPGLPVVTVLDPDDRWVRIYVREDRVGRVKIGARAEISSDSFPDKTYAGEVRFIASEAEFTPKNVQTVEERVRLVYAVKVAVTGDPGQELKPGLPADVRLPESP